MNSPVLLCFFNWIFATVYRRSIPNTLQMKCQLTPVLAVCVCVNEQPPTKELHVVAS